MGLSIEVQANISSSFCSPKCFNLPIRYRLWFTFEQMLDVLVVHFRSDVKYTPRSLILSTGWSIFSFNFRFKGAVLYLLKLKVMILHLPSLIIILSSFVFTNSEFKTFWRISLGSPEYERASVLSSTICMNL